MYISFFFLSFYLFFFSLLALILNETSLQWNNMHAELEVELLGPKNGKHQPICLNGFIKQYTIICGWVAKLYVNANSWFHRWVIAPVFCSTYVQRKTSKDTHQWYTIYNSHNHTLGPTGTEMQNQRYVHAMGHMMGAKTLITVQLQRRSDIWN